MFAAREKKPGLRAQKHFRRRARILRAAEQLFAGKGYDGTRMSEIAEQAGVTTPTVFNNFGSKVELLLAVMVTAHEAACARVDETRLAWRGDVAGGLCEILRVYLENMDGILSKQAWRLAEASYITMPDSEFVRLFASIDERNAAQLEAFLAQALPEHLAQPGPPELLARTIYNNWVSRYVEFIRDDDQSPEQFHGLVERDVNGLLDLVLNGAAPAARAGQPRE